MKKRSLLFGVLTAFLAVILVSCDESEDAAKNASILPSSFNIDVPTSLANSNGLKSGNASIDGNEVYEMMRAFVAIGNGSGAIVKDLMTAISYNNIDKPMDVTFLSADDNRLKRLIVTAKEMFEGNEYEYKMVIKDVQDPLAPLSGLEMYWNRAPIEGVSIFSFYNLNKQEIESKDARYRIDYSEISATYDKTMEVSIIGIDTTGTENNIDNLKMFVGKKGDIIEVYGNANLPDAKIVDQTHLDGYNWAFVGRSNEKSNISVAQVALPPCTLNNLDNLFTNYSIKKVLNDEIAKEYPTAPQSLIDAFLVNTDSPAYFNGTDGFVSCGTSIPEGYSPDFINLSGLEPYSPSQIDDLYLLFSDEKR